MKKNLLLFSLVVALMFMLTINVTKNMLFVTAINETEEVTTLAIAEDIQLSEYQKVIKEINEEYGTSFQVGNLEMFREFEMNVKSIDEFRVDLTQDAKEYSKRNPSTTQSTDAYPKDAYNYDLADVHNNRYKKKTVLYNIIPLDGASKTI